MPRSTDETYYATRTAGRSKGVLHCQRDCYHIRDRDDSDIIDGPRSAFDPDQKRCDYCFDGGDGK